MSPHEFSVPISSLDAGGKSFTFPIRPAWIRGAMEGCEVTPSERDGTLEVRLSPSGADVVAQGTLEADLVVPCARCLGPANISISNSFSVIFVPNASTARGDDEEIVGSEEGDTLPYDGETVVLDDFVRDELLLESPMIPLCSEGCPGMSPSLVSNGPEADPPSDPIDPRLLPLLRWKTPQKS
ncbi:MAG: DUF177 domain-containing protein [Myxococcales bacterium]|nr:DUF177 domain-containing protein [Myxococcales bacterium]